MAMAQSPGANPLSIMPPMPNPSPLSLHLFCRVVDNYGDIGVCWRLARQLVRKHGAELTLFVDVLASFQRLESAVDITAVEQEVAGIRVLRWDEDFDLQRAGPPADVVIEAFGCTLPTCYIQAMAAMPVQPAWINLEYLSAEAWVEDCHENRSLYPSARLSKYFFFPGFSERTGGLLREQDLLAQRDVFQSDPAAKQAFLASIGVDWQPAQPHTQVHTQAHLQLPLPTPMPARTTASAPAHAQAHLPSQTPAHPQRLLSLFCYPDAPLASWFAGMAVQPHSTLCLVAEGVARQAVEIFLGRPAVAGARHTVGRLSVQVVPFLDQPGYDRLLWCCDMNLVRGEDSLVRAIWAGRPFLWDIYPQQEDAHLVKLDALLALNTSGMSPALAAATRAAWHAWRRRQDMAGHVAWFAPSAPEYAVQRACAAQWSGELAGGVGLAESLIRFLEKYRLKYGA
jgi:hypothetical protein